MGAASTSTDMRDHPKPVAKQGQTCTPKLCAWSVSTKQPTEPWIGNVLLAMGQLIWLMPKHKCTWGTGTAGKQRDGAGDAQLKSPHSDSGSKIPSSGTANTQAALRANCEPCLYKF